MGIIYNIVVYYTKGENWVDGKSVYEQALMDHGNFMADLLEKGLLVISGPLTDSIGGLLILNMDSLEEARYLIKKDPGVINGVFKAEIKQLHVAFKEKTA